MTDDSRGSEGPGEGYELEGALDLASISEGERAVGCRRRVLLGVGRLLDHGWGG